MPVILEINKGDFGFVYEFTIKEADGSVVVLTGYTVKFQTWVPGASVLTLNKTLVLSDPTNGKVNYAVASGDFDTVTVYIGQLELTKTGEERKPIKFTVKVYESL